MAFESLIRVDFVLTKPINHQVQNGTTFFLNQCQFIFDRRLFFYTFLLNFPLFFSLMCELSDELFSCPFWVFILKSVWCELFVMCTVYCIPLDAWMRGSMMRLQLLITFICMCILSFHRKMNWNFQSNIIYVSLLSFSILLQTLNWFIVFTCLSFMSNKCIIYVDILRWVVKLYKIIYCSLLLRDIRQVIRLRWEYFVWSIYMIFFLFALSWISSRDGSYVGLAKYIYLNGMHIWIFLCLFYLFEFIDYNNYYRMKILDFGWWKIHLNSQYFNIFVFQFSSQ